MCVSTAEGKPAEGSGNGAALIGKQWTIPKPLGSSLSGEEFSASSAMAAGKCCFVESFVLQPVLLTLSVQAILEYDCITNLALCLVPALLITGKREENNS